MGLNNIPLLKSQNIMRLGRGQWSSKSDNRGQAVIEYMLLIFVSVTFVVTIALSVFQPLGQFVDSLNRLYIQCLLETGELPQLSSQDDSTVCFEELPRFAALDENGNPVSSEGSSRRGRDRNEAVANRDGQTSNASGGVRSTRPSRTGGGVGVSRGNASPEPGPDKTTIIPVDQSFNEGSGFMASSSDSQSGRTQQRKTRRIAVDSLSEYDRQNLERNIQKNQKTSTSENEGFTQTQKKKIIVKPPPVEKKMENIQAETGFGYYFKMFLLLIFILFIIIVFGSQAYQLSKSWGSN
jgi:hypothetical protein